MSSPLICRRTSREDMLEKLAPGARYLFEGGPPGDLASAFLGRRGNNATLAARAQAPDLLARRAPDGRSRRHVSRSTQHRMHVQDSLLQRLRGRCGHRESAYPAARRLPDGQPHDSASFCRMTNTMRRPPFDHKQHESPCLSCTRHPPRLDLPRHVQRYRPASRQTVDADRFGGDRIARRTRAAANRTLRADEHVEQRRLSDVWSTNDRDAQPFAHETSSGASFRRRRCRLAQRRDHGRYRWRSSDSLFGKSTSDRRSSNNRASMSLIAVVSLPSTGRAAARLQHRTASIKSATARPA